MGRVPRATPTGADPIAHLITFLSGPNPQLLLVKGAPGAGKSTLLARLAAELQGPRIFIAYRADPATRGEGGTGANEEPTISLMLVDPEATASSKPEPPGGHGGAMWGPASEALTREEDVVPTAILGAIERMTAQGGGYIFADSWSRSTERTFLAYGPRTRGPDVMSVTIRGFRERLGNIRVHTVVAMVGVIDPELESLADGIVDLGWEEQEGCRLRVLSLPKLRWESMGGTRFLYSLTAKGFYCPARLPAGFQFPIGPSSPDPEASEGSQWPGSAAFAAAFGRFRDNSLTGIELSPSLPHRLMDVIAIPAAAHVLLSGGRVLWIPSPQTAPMAICQDLLTHLPRETIRNQLRILSANPLDPRLGELADAVLPIRAEAPHTSEAPVAPGSAVMAAFPEGYSFLRDGAPGAPSLCVLSFQGLQALASVSGVNYRMAVFPLIIASYVGLPRFHGLGFGRSDDPMTAALIPSLETHIKMQQRFGRTILYGVRPESQPYMLDWPTVDGQYTLDPLI
jgi:hypothetical protein